MRTPAAGSPSIRQWIRPLLLVLCVLALGVAGQATALDIGVDAAVASAAANATPDDCAPAPGESTSPGHCAACCLHATGQLPPGAAIAAPAWFAPAQPAAFVGALPLLALVDMPERPPQA